VTPEWFRHQSWRSTVKCQLSSHWANSEFLGFSLCGVIAFRSVSHSLQVKCTYHFRNEHGYSHDIYCYLHGWYDEKCIKSEHIFVGLDPCLVAIKDESFSEYSEVSVEFQPEDMDGNLLPLNHCQVVECGVRPLYKDEIHCFDLIMQDYYRFYPPDRDGLEAMFQAKRARFEGMRWEDYSAMCRTYEFLAISLSHSVKLYRLVCFSNLCYVFFLSFSICHVLILKRFYFNCVNRGCPMFQKGYIVSATPEM